MGEIAIHMKKVLVFFKHTALCASVGDAVNFINNINQLTCNETTLKNLQRIFNGEDIRPYKTPYCKTELATTGCGNSRIYVYDSLGNTIEEHNAIYEQRLEDEKKARIAESEQAKQRRLNELNEEKEGWYAVKLHEIEIHGFRTRGNDRPIFKNFSVKTIAKSGADAYRKVAKHLDETLMEDVTNHNFTYSGHFLPSMLGSNYSFTYLGYITDDGFSEM